MSKLDLNKPVRTKSGEPVTLITSVGRGKFQVVGYIGDNTDVEEWRTDGRYYDNGPPSQFDLENVPEKVELGCFLMKVKDTAVVSVPARGTLSPISSHHYLNVLTAGQRLSTEALSSFTLIIEDGKVTGIKQ